MHRMRLCEEMWVTLHFLILVVIPGYMLAPEDFDPEFTNKRKHIVFVFLGLSYLTQYNIC